MSDQPPAPSFQDYPKLLSNETGIPGVICLFRDADGTVSFAGHGVNNSEANEMLSIGIFINLDQHYRNVEAGMAGPEAQRRNEEIKQLNGGE
ncbi:hypothetical protein [Pseudomonas knackmussii]|uniref:hypothetical protein n=1 Tax=Pseudomonas knackmussii TaxID=65741 RepID=UPI003F4A4E7E